MCLVLYTSDTMPSIRKKKAIMMCIGITVFISIFLKMKNTASSKNTPTASSKNTPTASSKNTPTASSKNTPTASSKNTPTASSKNTPLNPLSDNICRPTRQRYT